MPGPISKKEAYEADKELYALQEFHCTACGRFIGYQAIIWGVIKIKCPRCKEWTIIDITPQNKL